MRTDTCRSIRWKMTALIKQTHSYVYVYRCVRALDDDPSFIFAQTDIEE